MSRELGRHPRGSRAARAAGVTFLPLPLVPFILGLAAVVDPPASVGCFEYCDFNQNIGRMAVILGVVGVWIAILIWRRHVAAMALALFVAVLLTTLWLIGIFAPILTSHLNLLLEPVLLLIGAVLFVSNGLLVVAMRVEMIRAGEDAVAAMVSRTRPT